MEEKEIFFPKIIKSIFVVTGTDQKIYQGNYQINKDDSVYEIFKKIKNHENSYSQRIARNDTVDLFSQLSESSRAVTMVDCLLHAASGL